MDKPRIYLETSIFSFYYEERKNGEYPVYKAQVRKLFDLIKTGEFKPYTSPVTLQEMNMEADHKKREKMSALLLEYDINILDETDEVNRIARLYIKEKAVSSAWETDAIHIAMTTINSLDFIISLNFTHIARPWTIERVRQVNMREGFGPIGIYKPAEVLEIYEDGTGIYE